MALLPSMKAKSLATEIEFVEGMQFDRGYLSPYFVTDAQAMQCVLEDCYILVYEKKISTVKDIVPLLEAVVNASKPLLIVSEEVDGEALATLVINRLRGTFQVSAVKAPGYGDRRKAMLEDIAILTGATAVFENLGMKLDNIGLAELGSCQKRLSSIKITRRLLKGLVKQLTSKHVLSRFDGKLKMHQAIMIVKNLKSVSQNSLVVLPKSMLVQQQKVKMKEKKARVEDALHATRAAVEEGILPGGGVALLRASSQVKPKGLSDDESVGYQIVVRASRSPVTMISTNAGQDGSIVCEKVLSGEGNFGYNAGTDKYEDLVKAGVIDPAKVTRTALQNATSVSTLLLTSDALIAEKPKDAKG